MKSRRFGQGNRAVSVIGQGTWQLDHSDSAKAIAALRRGLDLGMTHIDTAEMYGNAEDIVSKAIAGRRDDVFLVSKVLPSNATKTKTVAACERSLRALGTDRLDCYLLHWRGSVPLEETFHAFDALEQAGKILSWGVSNFDVDDLEEAHRIVGVGKIACNQVLYHLQERAIEHAVLPWCKKHGVTVTGYSPFGHSRFPGVQSAGGRLLGEIAKVHNATPRQVALAFLSRDEHVFAIPKASTVPHVEENAGGGDLRLTQRELDRIDAAFPAKGSSRGLPMI